MKVIPWQESPPRPSLRQQLREKFGVKPQVAIAGSYENPVSLRCEYCDDHSHLTVECPGLRHGNPIAKAFKAERFGAKLVTPVCSRCNEPTHAGRPLFPVSVAHPVEVDDQRLICGDCVAGGTPLTPLPVVEPLTAADCNSWSTACEEGVG